MGVVSEGFHPTIPRSEDLRPADPSRGFGPAGSRLGRRSTERRCLMHVPFSLIVFVCFFCFLFVLFFIIVLLLLLIFLFICIFCICSLPLVLTSLFFFPLSLLLFLLFSCFSSLSLSCCFFILLLFFLCPLLLPFVSFNSSSSSPFSSSSSFSSFLLFAFSSFLPLYVSIVFTLSLSRSPLFSLSLPFPCLWKSKRKRQPNANIADNARQLVQHNSHHGPVKTT